MKANVSLPTTEEDIMSRVWECLEQNGGIEVLSGVYNAIFNTQVEMKEDGSWIVQGDEEEMRDMGYIQ